MARSGPTGDGCMFRYPNSEGWAARKSFVGAPVDSIIPTGKWYRLRFQVFPDGSCGVAVNGRVVQHLPVMQVVPDSMIVALSGQTVGSNLLFGRVQVWSGVPGDIDWSVVGRKGQKGRN